MTRYGIQIFLMMLLLSTHVTHAATGGIDSTHTYAWSENYGWINFGTSGGNVVVSDSELTGYAWNANTGWINLHPSASVYVHNSGGTLSGYAWGENLGYINFSGVTIDSDGYFHGTATGEVSGDISFNCAHTSSCASSDFKVRTDWRPASSGSSGGGGGGSNVLNVSSNASTKLHLPTLTLYAWPLHIAHGSSTNLIWQSNGTRCAASGAWSGIKRATGVEAVRAFTTTDYSLICTNISGETKKTVRVTVAGTRMPETIAVSTTTKLLLPSLLPERKIATVSALFKKDLSFGQKNDDVRRLQILLSDDPTLYPEALITGYFGVLTRAAVERFQARYNIVHAGTPATTGYGRVGRITRTMFVDVYGQ